MISIEYAEELFENGEYRYCLQVLDKLSEDDHLKLEMRTYCLMELEDYKGALVSVNQALSMRNSYRMQLILIKILDELKMNDELKEQINDTYLAYGFDHEIISKKIALA
jgi:hypothetical protein